jgi:hypothetical protein
MSDYRCCTARLSHTGADAKQCGRQLIIVPITAIQCLQTQSCMCIAPQLSLSRAQLYFFRPLQPCLASFVAYRTPRRRTLKYSSIIVFAHPPSLPPSYRVVHNNATILRLFLSASQTQRRRTPIYSFSPPVPFRPKLCAYYTMTFLFKASLQSIAACVYTVTML